ncbi:hypothetical protein Q8A67_007658 [Cirrhinus molitorella]|uniref:Uncharacterized protein n=1 Tax=Cirrhinus molitorella TaxID=172907 RepID=A0AA88Q1P0_9TELE|nr:hypothetical protein Q8A67_007658 [Cirrhinus molitorella]
MLSSASVLRFMAAAPSDVAVAPSIQRLRIGLHAVFSPIFPIEMLLSSPTEKLDSTRKPQLPGHRVHAGLEPLVKANPSRSNELEIMRQGIVSARDAKPGVYRTDVDLVAAPDFITRPSSSSSPDFSRGVWISEKTPVG